MTYRLFILLFAALISLQTQAAQQAQNQPTPKKERAFAFQQLSVPDFISSVYGDVLELSYIISPEVLAIDKKVVAYISPGRTSTQIKSVADDYLSTVGIISSVRGSVLFFSLASEVKQEKEKTFIEIYRPNFRSTAFLTEAAVSLFPDVVFASKRSLKPVALVTPTSPVTGSIGASGKPSSPSQPSRPAPAGSALDQVDKDSDTLIFQGSRSDLDSVLSFFGRIDQPVKQVVVKAYLYEVQKNNDASNAIQFAGSVLGSKFGINLNGGVNSTSGGNASITFNSASFDAVLSVLGSDSHFKLLSSPVLRVRSGATASFNVGSDVPTLGATSKDSLGNTLQSVEYQPSGVIFKITPTVRVSAVDIDVDQELSSFAQTTTGVNSTPTRLRRQLQTSLSVTGSDIVLMGGLDVSQDSDSHAGLRLPSFLRSSSSSSIQSSLLLVLSVESI